MNMRREDRGFIPLVAAIIIGVVVLVAGVGGYFGYKALKSSKDSGSQPSGQEAGLEWEDELGSLDFSVSGLESSSVPDLTVSGDLSFELPGLDLSGMSGVYVDLSVPEPDVDAPAVPSLEPTSFDFSGLSALAQRPSAPTAPSGTSQDGMAGPPDDIPDGPPADIPTGDLEVPTEPPAEDPTPEPPPQSEVNSSNCAQFATMPSASYCSQVGDARGQQLCQDCKAAGY
jgi:hypothetical protein